MSQLKPFLKQESSKEIKIQKLKINTTYNSKLDIYRIIAQRQEICHNLENDYSKDVMVYKLEQKYSNKTFLLQIRKYFTTPSKIFIQQRHLFNLNN